MARNILIIGATSAIAKATAKGYASKGDRLYLLARHQERLTTLTKDLEALGAKTIDCQQMDVNNFDKHQPLINMAFEELGKIDVVLIAHGTLPDQKAGEKSFHTLQKELNTNAMSTLSLLTHLANQFEAQKSGTIAVITSVAGDRGRQSNYIYGSAKGMVSIFLQGLRNRLHKSGVNVLDIKPGFVDTPMTTHFKKGLLWVQPDTIAKDIIKGVDKNKSEIYTPCFWRLIMLIICCIPEFIFKKMNL